MEAEVREAGISITDDDVNRYIEQVKKNNSLSEEDLKTALSREGQTLASYKASVKSEMEKSEIIDRQVKRKVNITDDDVERYYKLNAKKFRANDRARIRHILLPLAENAPPDQVQVKSPRLRSFTLKSPPVRTSPSWRRSILKEPGGPRAVISAGSTVEL